MKISAPWVKFCRELEALFAEDPEVRVAYDDAGQNVQIFVDNDVKADALAQLLPEKKVFGNVVLNIEIIPANREATTEDLINRAFDGNPALKYLLPVDSPFGHFAYAVFENKVVQFFNDDISDINGNCSTLYEQIARDVFEKADGVFFCTEAADKKLTKPLGEWP